MDYIPITQNSNSWSTFLTLKTLADINSIFQVESIDLFESCNRYNFTLMDGKQDDFIEIISAFMKEHYIPDAFERFNGNLTEINFRYNLSLQDMRARENIHSDSISLI